MAPVARLALLLSVAGSVLGEPQAEVKAGYIPQPVDHFNETDNRTWNQNYWVREDLFRRGGPVFLTVGAEWSLTGYEMMSGEAWERYAEDHHALMFQLEHRFYGDSFPTSDLSTENLQYLSIKQALADLTNFIEEMNRQYNLPEDTRWIAFGCSFAASLAGWLRGQRPDLVYGVVASGFSPDVRLDFPAYLEGVRSSLQTYSQECVDAAQQAFIELDQLVAAPNGSQLIKERMWLCNDFDTRNEKDVMTLNDKLANDLMGVVQFSTYWDHYNDTSMNLFCKDMVDKSSNKTNLRKFLAASVEYVGSVMRCTTANYSDKVRKLQDPEKSWINPIERQYTYQLCTELGWFQTSDSENAYLGKRLPLKYYLDLCKDVFGDKFTEDFVRRSVARTNEVYGGLEANTTRVIHVKGTLDPWKALSVTTTKDPQSRIIVIPGATHCEDTRASRDSDPPALREARRNISSTIGQWLNSL